MLNPSFGIVYELHAVKIREQIKSKTKSSQINPITYLITKTPSPRMEMVVLQPVYHPVRSVSHKFTTF